MTIFYFLICCCWLVPLYSRYIKPYKNLAFDISRPFVQTPNILYKVTFSTTESNIPPSAYFVISFTDLQFFQNKYIGSLYDCLLTDYQETIGAYFDPTTDLNNDKGNIQENYISQCITLPYYPLFLFQLNQTLIASQIYQLSFKMTAQFSFPFYFYISLFFLSAGNPGVSYIYSENIFYYIYGIFNLPFIYQNVTISSQKTYFSKYFYDKINTVLADSILSYTQAMTLSDAGDIAIRSFNDMLGNIDILQWDPIEYPLDIVNYAGFFGNIILELYIDQEISEFTAFELEIPQGWQIEQSNCISVDFYLDNNTKIMAIPHTSCLLQNDNQTLILYNILTIKANSYLRFNITNIRNPIIPIAGITKLSIFNEKTKQFIYQNKNISGLEVKSQKLTNVSFYSFIHDSSSFYLNKTQRYMINMSIPYYDLIGEIKIVIKQNNSNFEDYGFIEGSCQVIDKQQAIEQITNRTIQCIIDKTDNTLVIMNIHKLSSDKNFYIYFMNINEEINIFLSFSIEIYAIQSIKAGNIINKVFSDIPSYYYNQTIELINETLTISEAYYELFNQSKIFDYIYEISPLNKPYFHIKFALVDNNFSCYVKNTLNLLINPWISIDSDNLICWLSNISFPCVRNNNTYTNIISLNITDSLLTYYNNNTITLTIYGLSYSYITFNSYISVFDYYLIYQCDENSYTSYITANNSLQIKTSPNKNQILVIGGANNSLIPFAFMSLKFETPLLSFYKEKVNVNSLQIKVFLMNVNNSQYNDYDYTNCIYSAYSSIKCQFRQGVNINSSLYLNWDYYLISNISIHSININDYITIPIILDNIPPIFYIEYDIITKEFIILYDLYEKIVSNPMNISTADDLMIDWGLTNKTNDGDLNAHQSSIFIFTFNFSQEIVQKLINDGSGYIMFLVSWLITLDDAPVQCSFDQYSELSIIPIVLDDKIFGMGSALLLSINGFDFLNGIDLTEGIEDIISCYYLMTPTSISFNGGYGIVMDSNGVIIANKELDREYNVFKQGFLDLKRMLVTPNNINFISAHYAVYFTNQFEISNKDYVGISLPYKYYSNVSDTDLLIYFSYLPQDYDVPVSGSSFEFDEFDYEQPTSQRINPLTTSIIRLKYESVNTMKNQTNNSTYLIYIILDLIDNIPPDSLLLLEVFGITNPSQDNGSIQIVVFQITELGIETLMKSIDNHIHYFVNNSLNYQDLIDMNISSIMPIHINGLYHIPTTLTISLNELILPNFWFCLAISDNIAIANSDNSNIKVFVDIYNNNIDVISKQNEQYNTLESDGIDNTDTTLLQEDSQDSNNSDKNPPNYGYMQPTIKDYIRGVNISLNVGRPSLSQRTLVVSYYKFLLPDNDDTICVTLIIQTKGSNLVNKSACCYFSRPTYIGNLSVNFLKSDVNLEFFTSNLTIQITTNFNIYGLFNFLVIIFDEPLTLTDSLNVWINHSLIATMIYDKVILCFIPDLPANTPFVLELTDYINPVNVINKTGVLIIGTVSSDSTVLSQNIFSLDKSQSLSTIMAKITINDIYPNILNTYELIPVLSIKIGTMGYVPMNNDTFRCILPNDFPANYLIDGNIVNCSLTLLSEGNQELIKNLCVMKENIIDLTIIQVISVTNSKNLEFIMNISNLYASSNYGNSGDFSIMVFSWINGTYIVKGASLRSNDIYSNPVITQSLQLINKYESLTQTTTIDEINIKKGSIKPIYLIPDDNKGFKNDISIEMDIYGNPSIKPLNSSISIRSGDLYGVFYVYAEANASNVVAYCHFNKKEGGIVKKYQEIYPLYFSISLFTKIIIVIPDIIAVYIGGESSFIEVTCNDISKFSINVTISPLATDLVGFIENNNNNLVFQQNKSMDRFRVKLSSLASEDENYYIQLNLVETPYSNLFSLSTDKITIKPFRKPPNLNNNTLNFKGNIQIYCKSIDIIISNLNYPVLIYYQIEKQMNSNFSIINTQEIIDRIDIADDYKIIDNIGNKIIGVFQCNDTTVICKKNIINLEVFDYFLQCFAYSPAGYKSSLIYNTTFQPYPIKPLVISLGFIGVLPDILYNDLLCAFVDFFGIYFENLYLENNSTCNQTLFSINNNLSNIYSLFSNSLTLTSQYLKEFSSTFKEFGLNINKLKNLNFSLLTNFVSNAATIENLISLKSQTNLKMYLYPPDSSPNMNMTNYINMINDQLKTSYFKSRYSFLQSQFFFKVSGILGSNNDIQSLMPIFIGAALIRTDNNIISLTLQISNEGVVYAVAIRTDSSYIVSAPDGLQIALGLDGVGNKSDGSDKKNTEIDSDGNLKPLIIKFDGLENDVIYEIYYTTGLNVPRELLVNKNVWKLTASPKDPFAKQKTKRILYGDQ